MNIRGISMVCVFSIDYARSLAFYRDLLGLRLTQEMGETSSYFELPDGRGLYLATNSAAQPADKNQGLSFCFDVEHCRACFDLLKGHDIRIVQAEPMPMGENLYWFQAFDPDGNCIEFLGPV